MNNVTPRVRIHKNINELIGGIANSNCFPTMRGKFIYIKDDRCYFEMVANDIYPKYNYCVGKIEYLLDHMVATMKFEENESI